MRRNYKKYIPLFILLIILLIIIFLCRPIIQAAYFMFVNNIKTDGFLSYAFLYDEIFIKQEYNFPLQPGMTIFDVGANIGLFNIYMNQILIVLSNIIIHWFLHFNIKYLLNQLIILNYICFKFFIQYWIYFWCIII